MQHSLPSAPSAPHSTTPPHSLHSLLRKRDALLSDLAALNLHISQLSNHSVPLFKLSSELIILIFHFSTQAWPESSTPFEFVASHVCARWRDIILHLPHFWNSFHFNIPASHPKSPLILYRLSLYLRRSYPLPLDISLTSDLHSALNLLLPHASRWRRLCLITSSSATQPIHQSLHQLPVPVLEYLSIRTPHSREFDDSGPYLNFPSLLPQILSSTASLSFVRLAGVALWTLQPSFSAVRTLHLDGCRSRHMSLQQFRTLMSTLPCLVNLSLAQLHIEPPADVESAPKTHLTSLKCIRICDEDQQPSIVMSLLELPTLHSLWLRSVEVFDSATLPIVPTVHSITFDDCPLSPNELWNIVQAFPSISSLTMDQTVEALYALLGFSNGQVKWPDLRTITVYDLIPVNVQIFCDMVQDRIQAGKPLSHVRLNRRSRNVLRNKDRLGWLCDRVVVENQDFEEAWPPGLDFHDPDDN